MGATLQSTIDLFILEKNDLESNILKLSNTKNLKHKHFSNIISYIRTVFSAEKTAIRSKIQTLDTRESREEYKQLLAELNEISDKEEQQVKTKESEMKDFENSLQLQIDQDQTRLESVKADLQQFKETNASNIKEEFSRYQNG